MRRTGFGFLVAAFTRYALFNWERSIQAIGQPFPGIKVMRDRADGGDHQELGERARRLGHQEASGSAGA